MREKTANACRLIGQLLFTRMGTAFTPISARHGYVFPHARVWLELIPSSEHVPADCAPLAPYQQVILDWLDAGSAVPSRVR